MSRTVPANFYLNSLATSAYASDNLYFNVAPPNNTVEPGVAATIYVAASEFTNVFQFGLNQAFTDQDNSTYEISNMLFNTTLTNASGKYWLAGIYPPGQPPDPLNSEVDMTTATIDDDCGIGPVPPNSQPLGVYFIKVIASQLFQTYEGDTLFNNQETFTDQLCIDIQQGLYAVITAAQAINPFVSENTIAPDNFAGTMFEAAVAADSSWLSDLPSMSANAQVTVAGETYDLYNLPVITGDKIYFNLSLTPNADQNLLSGVEVPLDPVLFVVCIQITS